LRRLEKKGDLALAKGEETLMVAEGKIELHIPSVVGFDVMQYVGKVEQHDDLTAVVVRVE
jgi:hypothetical protein